MKGETMLTTMQRLGVAASRSRPAVSNHNPYSEALFRTLKYRPQLPVKPFNGLLQARRWVTELVHWYNHEHRHSAIGFVTPAQRHMQIDQALLDDRAKVYAAARDANPNRWSGPTRNWDRIAEVHLNPETQKKTEPTHPKNRLSIKLFATTSLTSTVAQTSHGHNLHHAHGLFMQPHDLLAPLVKLLQRLLSRVFFFHSFEREIPTKFILYRAGSIV